MEHWQGVEIHDLHFTFWSAPYGSSVGISMTLFGVELFAMFAPHTTSYWAPLESAHAARRGCDGYCTPPSASPWFPN